MFHGVTQSLCPSWTICIVVVVQWLLCTHSAEYLDVFDLGYTQGHVCLSNGHYASQRHLSCVACSDRWNCQWDVWTIYPCIHVIVSATHGELTTILFNIEILHVLSHVTVHFIGDVSISQCICKLLHHNIDYSLVLLHLKMCFCHLGLLGLSWSLLWFVQETACICSCHDCLYHVTDNIHVLYISLLLLCASLEDLPWPWPCLSLLNQVSLEYLPFVKYCQTRQHFSELKVFTKYVLFRVLDHFVVIKVIEHLCALVGVCVHKPPEFVWSMLASGWTLP